MILHVPEISSHYFRVAQDLRRRTIGNTAAKVEHGDSIGNLLDQVHVVIDDQNGEPVSLKTLQKLDELAFFDSIQASLWQGRGLEGAYLACRTGRNRNAPWLERCRMCLKLAGWLRRTTRRLYGTMTRYAPLISAVGRLDIGKSSSVPFP